jgi:hypothetical protein
MSNFSLFLLFSIFISINCAEEIESRIRLVGENQWIIENAPFSDQYRYIATAFYTKGLEETGWDFLSITTNNFFDDKIQAEAAGRLEGSLTKDRIYNHYQNMLSTAGSLNNDTYNFLKDKKNIYYLKKMNIMIIRFYLMPIYCIFNLTD